MISKNKITVVGAGYVGMSLAVLLAQHNDVVVLDTDATRVDKINNKHSTIADEEIQAYLDEKTLNLKATLDKTAAYEYANFVVVATPTNYYADINRFDTSSVDTVVNDALEHNKNALVIIKSTIPLGHTKSLQAKHNTNRIIFSPEFLREGQALKDNLHPSRIIIGSQLEAGRKFASLLVSGSNQESVETLFMGASEAEAVKLFSNAYLAMRVSFFNELDSYALSHDLSAKSIINGVCLDERIGEGYNNPSFGYGGYCLPKDARQLLASFQHVPQTLIESIVSSNVTRINFIASEILKRKAKTVGIYRLVMKEGSDNFRESSIQGVIKKIREEGVQILVFEPELTKNKFLDLEVISNLDEFKKRCDIIVANRKAECLRDVSSKCFSRDIFGIN